MQSLLEYALDKLIGPPVENRWTCPRCKTDPPTLYLRSPSTDPKWRFGCQVCGDHARGDLADFLKLVSPHENWNQRKIRMAKLERDARRDPLFLSGKGEGDSEMEATVEAFVDLSVQHLESCSPIEREKCLEYVSEVLWLVGVRGMDPRAVSERIAMMCLTHRAFG